MLQCFLLNSTTKYCCFVLIILLFTSCGESTQPTVNSIPSEFTIPTGFPAPNYNFTENPYSKEGFELGKTLFYATELSSDNTVSCGSCHQQFGAFSNVGHDLSHGINSIIGLRNTPSLVNLAWQPFFAWDGGTHSLDDFSINPISNPIEMNETLNSVLQKLRNNNKYVTMFTKAFGSSEISTERLVKALSLFMVQMISNNS